MDVNFFWGVVALVCGTVMLVYGASLFRAVLLVAGFYIGFTLVNLLLASMTTGPSPWVRTTIAIVLGAALGALLFSMVRITIYAAGGLLGLVLALLLSSAFGFSSAWLRTLVGLGGLGLGAFIGPRLGRSLTIFSSAAAGAYVSVIGLAKIFHMPDAIPPGTMPMDGRSMTVFIVLAVISILAQSRVGEFKRVG